jgi:hypothetical protein
MMKRRKHLPLSAVIAALVLALPFLAGCAQKPVKVAIMTKLDAGSLIGTSEVDTVRLYLEKNKITNIAAVPINDGWDPTRIPAAWKEIRDQGIDIIITSHTSTCALELKKLTDLPDNNLRVVQDVSREQASLAQHIKPLGLKSLAILRDTDNGKYTEPALKYFLAAFGAPAEVKEISIKTLDMPAIEAFLRSRPFDGVYTLIGGNQTISGTLGQLAWNINPALRIFYTPWNNATTILETAGPSIGNATMASHYPPRSENPATEAYFKDFKAAFNYVPTYTCTGPSICWYRPSGPARPTPPRSGNGCSPPTATPTCRSISSTGSKQSSNEVDPQPHGRHRAHRTAGHRHADHPVLRHPAECCRAGGSTQP